MKIYSREYFLRKILECNEKDLEKALKQKESVCREDKIPKKGGYRSIVSVDPKYTLLSIQKNLLKNFLTGLPVSTAAKGFVKGRSYIDFLEEHIGHEYFLRLDIKDFFDSITEDSLIENLQSFAEEDIINDIVELCTWKGKVPQGFVTSPAVSNLIFRRTDQRIRKYCRAYFREMKREIFYTRYADDMLFSSIGFDFKKNKNFKRMISHILQENGFCCNESKTIFAKGEISLSGYVIHEDVHLSRKKLHNINEVIYQFADRKYYSHHKYEPVKGDRTKEIIANLNKKKLRKADGTPIEFKDVSSLVHYVAGYRSYLIQLSRAEHGDTGYDKQIVSKVKKLEMILKYLSELTGEA